MILSSLIVDFEKSVLTLTFKIETKKVVNTNVEINPNLSAKKSAWNPCDAYPFLIHKKYEAINIPDKTKNVTSVNNFGRESNSNRYLKNKAPNIASHKGNMIFMSSFLSKGVVGRSISVS